MRGSVYERYAEPPRDSFWSWFIINLGVLTAVDFVVAIYLAVQLGPFALIAGAWAMAVYPLLMPGATVLLLAIWKMRRRIPRVWLRLAAVPLSLLLVGGTFAALLAGFYPPDIGVTYVAAAIVAGLFGLVVRLPRT